MDDAPGETSIDELAELRLELMALRQRVETLEKAAVATPPSPAASAAPPPPPRYSQAAAPFRVDPPAKPSRDESASALENRIGAQLFNRVGVVAVLAGAAWFLKLAIDRAWVGPPARIVIGLAAGAALVLWSERFRRGGFFAFSYTLKALGAGLAYLSLWASLNLYHLLPAWVVFAAMVAVTGTNALLAWRQNSELLAALALVGGLATPALLATGAEREAFLFSYLLLLDAGALVLQALRPWPRLTLGAFLGTTAYYASWRMHYADRGDLTLSGLFVALLFLLFSAAPWLELRQASPGPGARRILTGLPIAVGLCAFLEVENLLSGTSLSGSIPAVVAALALVYLALVLVAHFDRQPADGLRAVHLSMATGALALAALLKFRGYGIPVAWLVELLALTAASFRIGNHALARPLRLWSMVMLCLSFGASMLLEEYDHLADGATAFLNLHFAAYLAGLIVFAVVAAAGLRMLPAVSVVEEDNLKFLTGAAVVAFNITALTAVGLQIEVYWHQALSPATGNFPRFHRPAYVDFTYSAWFMLYGAVLMAAGFLRRAALLRWQALVLLTLSIGKVFLFDTSHLSEGYRVASFLGLGALLLAVSFVYQRDWLGLRQK